MNIIYFLILALISFFPILIWAYSFAYIDQNPLNKKRFLVGILGGILSVFPILYMGKIVDFFDAKFFNFFYLVSNIKGFFSSLEFNLSLSLFIFLIVFCSFIFGLLLIGKKEIFKIYLRNFLIFLGFSFIFSLFILILNIFLNYFDFKIENPASFGSIIFDTFKLIIFYYLVVSFIEETSKHFNFLQSSIFSLDNYKEGVKNAIFVALGFAFIENILYLYNFFIEYGMSFDLVKIYFFRSFFSVIVHILCSSVIAYYFSKAYISYKQKNLVFPFIKIFFIGFLVSILLHLVFDISLTFGINIILFIYFVGGYLYVSSIFYKE